MSDPTAEAWFGFVLRAIADGRAPVALTTDLVEFADGFDFDFDDVFWTAYPDAYPAPLSEAVMERIRSGATRRRLGETH